MLAGASGTHSVCVYVYHHNPKLIVELNLKHSVHDLMSVSVCSTEHEACMNGNCEECPGQDAVTQHLTNCDEAPEEVD